jgi:tripartite tricarboxylate transporter family receptor
LAAGETRGISECAAVDIGHRPVGNSDLSAGSTAHWSSGLIVFNGAAFRESSPTAKIAPIFLPSEDRPVSPEGKQGCPSGAVAPKKERGLPSLPPLIGYPIVIENKAGASGIVGAKAVINASPDGYAARFVGRFSSHSTWFDKPASF